MAEVITFLAYRPPARYDSQAWTEARLYESADEDGTFTLIDTFALTPEDPDPEEPAARSFTTENGTALDYWYQIVFADADGDTSQPTTPIQNVAATDTAPVVAYATVNELARILQLGSPTPAQQIAMQRVLDAAAFAINSYLDRASAFTEPYPAAVVSANLQLAEDLWRYEQVPYGAVVLGGETGPIYPSRRMLARLNPLLLPLKESFGVG